MKKFLVWLYIIILIITTAVTVYCVTTKIKDDKASNIYWYIGGASFAIWIVILILLIFAIKSKSGYMTVEIPIGLEQKLKQDVNIYRKNYVHFNKAYSNPEYAQAMEYFKNQQRQ